MLNHSVLVVSINNIISSLNRWYEQSTLHRWLIDLTNLWQKYSKSSNFFSWGSQFFQWLSYSRVFRLCQLLLLALNTLIFWSHEQLEDSNSQSVLLKTINNFSSRETIRLSLALVCGGYGFGLLVNFILKRQSIALLGLLPIIFLVYALVRSSERGSVFKESVTYRILKKGSQLIYLDEEEV